jgi:uncharacterized membrane protein
MITIWLVYRLGIKLSNDTLGLWAAFLLAVSPFHIWYSQEVRMYGLLILLCTSSMYLFHRLTHKQSIWMVIGWIFTTALALYTHYYAVFIVCTQFIYGLLIWRSQKIQWPRVIMALVVLAALILPILIILFPGGRYAAVCAEGAGRNPITFFSIPYTFFAFSLGFSYGPSLAELHHSSSFATLRPYGLPLILGALLFATLFFLGLSSLRRNREAFLFLLLNLCIPIAGACLAALVLPQLSYNVRYVSMALPAYLFILAMGLTSLSLGHLRWFLLVGILICVFVSLNNYYFVDRYAKENYRLAAEIIEQNGCNGDVVLVTHLQPFRYYYDGDLTVHNLLWTPAFYRKLMAGQIRGFQRAWLVMSREWGADPQGKMKDFIRNNFPAVTETTFANIYLGLFELNARRTDENFLSREED